MRLGHKQVEVTIWQLVSNMKYKQNVIEDVQKRLF